VPLLVAVTFKMPTVSWNAQASLARLQFSDLGSGAWLRFELFAFLSFILIAPPAAVVLAASPALFLLFSSPSSSSHPPPL
jgi:hypothetical protein